MHVGPKEVYPWAVCEESGSRDSWWIANRCEAFFERAKAEQKPFFLTAAFIDPHRDRSRGGFGNDDKFDPHVKHIDIKPQDVILPSWISDTPESREEFVGYYRAVNRFDQGVGFILDRLAKTGYKDNTLIVVTSDNGPPFVNSKATLFDVGTCLPFIVRSPDCSMGGISNPNLVSWIDMLPTFLDFAGLPLNARSNALSPVRLGRSILPILHRADIVPESEWQHHIFCSHTFHQRENYWPTRVIRTRRYKYHRNTAWQLPFPFATDLYLSKSFEGIRNMAKPVYIGKRSLKNYIHRPAEELFDMETDPDEVHDLAQDPKYASIKLELRKKLEAWQMQTFDLWLYKDGQSANQINLWCTEEIEVPDRFDFEPEAPGTRGQEVGITFVKLGNAPEDMREIWPGKAKA